MPNPSCWISGYRQVQLNILLSANVCYIKIDQIDYLSKISAGGKGWDCNWLKNCPLAPQKISFCPYCTEQKGKHLKFGKSNFVCPFFADESNSTIVILLQCVSLDSPQSCIVIATIGGIYTVELWVKSTEKTLYLVERWNQTKSFCRGEKYL